MGANSTGSFPLSKAPITPGACTLCDVWAGKPVSGVWALTVAHASTTAIAKMFEFLKVITPFECVYVPLCAIDQPSQGGVIRAQSLENGRTITAQWQLTYSRCRTRALQCPEIGDVRCHPYAGIIQRQWFETVAPKTAYKVR
jgi:hypothetical protein